jgi:3-hydroxybutyryl-CoA dehydrogenase
VSNQQASLKSGSVIILGSGIMGCGIAAGFLKAGWQVQMLVRRANQHEPVRHKVSQLLAELQGDSNGADSTDNDRLLFVDAMEGFDFQDVALVLETVVEDLGVKQAMFLQLDRLVPASIPVVSNTSGFRISEIAQECETRARMAHAHFFMPAHQMPLVELAGASFTDPDVIDRLHQAFSASGRIPVRVASDIPGLLANRMQHALMREAWSMLEQGLASAQDIDAAVRYGFGFRYLAAGPLLQKEFSGLDTQALSAAAIYPSLCNDAQPASLLTDKVANGDLGIKSGRGLRPWPADKIAAEQQRYSAVLSQALALLMKDRRAQSAED